MDVDRLQKSPAGSGLLRWQAGIFAVILGFVVLVPRPDAATLLLPLAGHGRNATLTREISRGAAIAGNGPAGSVIVIHAQQGIGLRALQDGVLAIHVPEILCTNTRTERWTI